MGLNQYTELLTYIKSLADADNMVHTVTQDNIATLDIEKANIYPLVHIDINSGSFTNGITIILNVEIACLSQRDINNTINTDKFWKNDNEVDNFNTTLLILNRLWTNMYRDFQDNNYTASENPTLNKIEHGDKNILDGWIISFAVELPNTTLNLC